MPKKSASSSSGSSSSSKKEKKRAAETTADDSNDESDDRLISEISATDTDGDLDRAIQAMKDPQTGVEVKDRSWLLRSYPACFVGSQAVTWLCDNDFAVSRSDAVAVGELLQARGEWAHVTRDHSFKDEKLFYRFSDSAVNRDHGKADGNVLSWAQFIPNATQR
jgi:potassium-dependent mechanosensitive channel